MFRMRSVDWWSATWRVVTGAVACACGKSPLSTALGSLLVANSAGKLARQAVIEDALRPPGTHECCPALG